MGWAAHVILVSAQGPNPSFFFFGGLLFDLGACWDKGLDSDLDQGLTINNYLGPLPKVWKVIESMLLLFSLLNLSGSKTNGFVQYFGS